MFPEPTVTRCERRRVGRRDARAPRRNRLQANRGGFSRTGDLGLVESLIASDVVWHVPGDHPMARTIEGRAALLEWLARLRGIGFWLVEQDVFASDEHVCAISTMGARRDDVDVQTRVVSIFRYREGQQLERWLYPDDNAAWKAIFTT